MAFDDILKQIGEETDRTQLSELAKKYPSLKEFAELGEQARPILDRAGRLRLANDTAKNPFEALVNYGEAWDRWNKEHYDNAAGMTKKEKAMQDAMRIAEERIAELEARGETDMTADEVQKIVDQAVNKVFQDRGVVTKDKFEEVLPERLKKAATSEDVDKYMAATARRFEDVFTDLAPQVVEHQRLFGEKLDMARVLQRMRDHFTETSKAGKPEMLSGQQAYEAVYADKLKAQREKEQKDRDDALRAEGAKAERDKLRQEQGHRAMPVDGRGAQGPMGSVMKKFVARQKKSADGTSIEAPLGKGVIAATAAEQYVNKSEGA